jgi:hypothetical protein
MLNTGSSVLARIQFALLLLLLLLLLLQAYLA